MSGSRDGGTRRALTGRAVLAMASTASGGFFMLAVAWLATRRLSSTELGYFFSFLSLGALVPLADFGLSYAALQTAGRLAGTNRLRELPALSERVRRWNLAAAGAAAILVAGVGWVLFSTGEAGTKAARVAWGAPWGTYVLSVLLLQLTAPGISLREGSGKVEQMWRLRLAQEWIGGTAWVAALYFGGALWSLTVFALARMVVAASWLGLKDRIRAEADGPEFSLKMWMSEVWPFQWKIGLSGLSGFLIFRAFAPLVFLERGPILAGQIGLAIALMNLLIAISSAWPMSQAARYSTWIAAGRFEELRREFPILLWSSTALSAAAAVALASGLWWARGFGMTFALRLPAPETTAIFLAAAAVHHAVLCGAMFLRAEGREPLLAPSVLGALVTALLVWLAARFGGPTEIAIVNLVCALGGLPIVFFLLRSRQRRWLPSRSNGSGSDD